MCVLHFRTFHGPPHFPNISSFVLRLYRLRKYILTRGTVAQSSCTLSHIPSVTVTTAGASTGWTSKTFCKVVGNLGTPEITLWLQTTRLSYSELDVLFVQRCCGLHGLEFESQWRQDFSSCPDWPQGPPSLQYDQYRVFQLGKAGGVWCRLPLPSSARLQMGRSSISTSPLCPHRHVIFANSSKDTKQHLILNKCKLITDRLLVFPTYYRNHRQITVNQFSVYLVPVQASRTCLFCEHSKLTQVIFVTVAGMWGKDLSSAGVVLHYTVRDGCPAGVRYAVVRCCKGYK